MDHVLHQFVRTLTFNMDIIVLTMQFAIELPAHLLSTMHGVKKHG